MVVQQRSLQASIQINNTTTGCQVLLSLRLQPVPATVTAQRSVVVVVACSGQQPSTTTARQCLLSWELFCSHGYEVHNPNGIRDKGLLVVMVLNICLYIFYSYFFIYVQENKTANHVAFADLWSIHIPIHISYQDVVFLFHFSETSKGK